MTLMKNGRGNMEQITDKKRKGQWILVRPTDCFTMVPVYQCSICNKLTSGYEPQHICMNCGADNQIAPNQYIERAIFNETF